MLNNQVPIDPNSELTVTLTASEWHIVIVGLQELPFKVASPILQRITGQIHQARGPSHAQD